MAIVDEVTHTGRHLRYLEHCALHRRTITLTCRRCGQERRLDAIALWWFFERRGWDDRLPEAIDRLCCAPCRATGITARFRFAITRDPPDADQPEYPAERDWKRIVTRYRS